MVKRAVFQYNIKGKKIGKFVSPVDAERQLGLYRGSVSASCTRDKLRAGSWIFRYADDCDDISNFVRQHDFENTGVAKKVYQYGLDGNFIREWKSCAAAQKALSIKSSIASCCMGNAYSCGGFYWSHAYVEKIEVPKPRGRRVKYSLADFCRDNPSFTYLIDEWQEELNEKLPSEVSYGSSSKKYFWKCKNGHIFDSLIPTRIGGSGCRYCKSGRNTSFPEQAIYYYIHQLFPDSISRFSDKATDITELDVFIPSIKVGIEYDGGGFHKDMAKDLNKNKICVTNDIKLYRIREKELPTLNSSSTDYIIPDETDDGLTRAIVWLTKQLGSDETISIDVKRDSMMIEEKCRTEEKENSLEILFPDIANEWDYEANNGISPSFFSAYSGRSANFICPKCGKHYPMIISNRTRHGQGCPDCGQERSRKAKLRLINQYTLDGELIASHLGAQAAALAIGKDLYNKSFRNINTVCRRRQKTAWGYIWRYADDCGDISKNSAV